MQVITTRWRAGIVNGLISLLKQPVMLKNTLFEVALKSVSAFGFRMMEQFRIHFLPSMVHRTSDPPRCLDLFSLQIDL